MSCRAIVVFEEPSTGKSQLIAVLKDGAPAWTARKIAEAAQDLLGLGAEPLSGMDEGQFISALTSGIGLEVRAQEITVEEADNWYFDWGYHVIVTKVPEPDLFRVEIFGLQANMVQFHGDLEGVLSLFTKEESK